MRPWDLDTSASSLRSAAEDLQAAWQLTQHQWSDSVSRDFCQMHLEPIGPAVKQALDAVGRMQQLINQMRREVDEE